MANRYPLIVDSSSENIKELPAGDGLLFADNDKIVIGTGSDLTLYHDASNSYITNAIGALKVATETSGIAVTIGHTTSETTVADNLTVTGDFSVGGNFDVTGTLDFSDSAISNVGDISLDSISGDSDSDTAITFSGSNVITVKAANADQVTFIDGAIVPSTDNDIDLGTSSVEFKDAFFDGTVTSDAFAGPLTGAVTGNADTATTLATARTIGGVSFDGSANIVPATVTVADTTDTSSYVALFESATGDLGPKTDAGVTYNAGTGMLTATGFTGPLTGNVTGNASGTALTVTQAAQTAITSVGTLTALAVDNITINGNDISSTAGTDLTITPLSGQQIVLDGTIVIDAGVVTGATSVTSTAFVGDITGDVTGTSSLVTVTDSTANTNFPVVFNNESDALLDDTGALRYNPSTGTLLVPNLSVAGTTTTVDTVTMEASNAIIFEGATADGNETTLSIVDPTADHTQYLINQGGYIPVLAAATTTAISSTPAELNLLDGSVANSVVNSKAVIYGSSGELAGTLSTAAQTNITRVGASLGIGLTPTHNFNLQAAGTVEARFRSTDGDCSLQISSDTDEGQNSELAFYSGTSNRGSILYDHHATAASQKMIFKTGDNTERMRIDGSGYVGIGIDSPTEKIDVNGAIRLRNNAIGHNAVEDVGMLYYVPTADDGSNPRTALQAVGTSSVGAHIMFLTGTSSSTTERMRIDKDGNVGIGTYTPATALTVATAANITQTALTSSSNAVAWDSTAKANAYHVTTENTTFSAPTNAIEGAIISVEIAQGGTARTIAWNTIFEFAASTAPTMTATANKTDIYTFRYNGSVWQEIGRVQNMAQT